MSRHVLTLGERIRGIRNAIASPRTPPQLKPGLRKLREVLLKRAFSQKPKRRTKPKRPASLVDWLGL